jgi:formylglycine-generating enzyme required for sulfatase activity
MANTPPETPQSDAVEHFHDILIHCVQECADTRCGPYDVFLWNARRVAEAILYALAVGTETGRTTGRNPSPDLGNLVKALVSNKRLHDKIQHDFETLRSCGNVGAHTQHLDTVVDETTLNVCLSSIVLVVEWFYRSSALARPMPTAVARALVELKSSVQKLSRTERQERQLAEAITERDNLKHELQTQKERMRELQRAFAGQQEELPTVTEIRALAGHDRSWPKRLGWTALGLLLGLGASLAAMQLAGYDQSGASGTQAPKANVAVPVVVAAATVACPPPPACPTCEAVPATAEGAAPESPPPPAPVPEPAAAAPPSTPDEPTCPEGMLLVRGGTLRLASGPVGRKKWPTPKSKPQTPDLPSFCIDLQAIRAKDFALATLPDVCRPVRGNAARKGAGSLAVNQVSRACAVAYCAARDGLLPTAAQWEWALRSSHKPQLDTKTGEFVLDTIPFEVFGYRSVGGASDHGYFTGLVAGSSRSNWPLLSWNIDKEAAKGLRNVSFRCATTVGED